MPAGENIVLRAVSVKSPKSFNPYTIVVMQFSTEKNVELLLLQLKNGSEAAFNSIYKLYGAKLYASLLYLVKSEEAAKEILQDVFFKIWNKREEIDPSRSFKSLLFRIGENLIYDYFRKVFYPLK